MSDFSRRFAALSPEKRKALLQLQKRIKTPVQPIAVIGMGCRFPGGANDPDSLWRVLHEATDAIREVPPDRWDADAFYDPDPSAPGKMNSRWGGFLNGVDQFDPAFFGITPREAIQMDPQQRMLLEVAYEALEDAGQPLDQVAGSETGVFIGVSTVDYMMLNPADPKIAGPYLSTGSAHSVHTGRLSYLFDLQGPSIAVDTACSSSLVALHLGCQSLRSGECTMALVGGVNLILAPYTTISFSKFGFLSSDGRCKTFDARADGYVRGEGCGVLVLKPLLEALEDGDPVAAVIRGSAVNQDGRSAGLTAPNGRSQQAVMRRALSAAGVDPKHVGYLEAHGTGTPLGDPIELDAVNAVYGSPRETGRSLAIGSIKTNFGHLEAAAGVAGLMKTVLALRYGRIPAHLHLQTLNPNISLENTPAFIPTETCPWPDIPGSRLAAVSSFGFSGTNAHAVLESVSADVASASADAVSHLSAEVQCTVLVPFSARHPQSLRALVRAHVDALSRPTGEPLAAAAGAPSLQDLAYTASRRRTHHEHRLAVVARSRKELAEALDAMSQRAPSDLPSDPPGSTAQKIIFVFSGQGSQYAQMGRALSRYEPVFTETLQQCEAALSTLAPWSLSSVLADEASHSRLDQTEIAQPALCAVQISLVALWRSWGVVPDVVIGHSVGEIAAAFAAGIFTVEEAMRVAVHRGRLMQRTAGQGRMAALEVSETRARTLLERYEARLSLAAINSPSSIVLSGDPTALEEVIARVREESPDALARMLDVDYAFHSPQMDPILADLETALAGLHPRAATRARIRSTVTAQAASGEAFDVHYWTRNVRQPVRFAEAIQAEWIDGDNLVVEIGPHPVLSRPIAQCLEHEERAGAVIASLRRGGEDRAILLGGLGTLYEHGRSIRWDALYPSGRCVSLPAYRWNRQRYWIEAGTSDRHVDLHGEAWRDASERARGAGKETPIPTQLRSEDDAVSFLRGAVSRIVRCRSEQLRPESSLQELGLDSLMAAELKHTVEADLDVELSLAEILRRPTLADLAQALFQSKNETGERRGQPELLPAPESERLREHPLSYGQQALWLLRYLAPPGIAFNVSGAVRIEGTIAPTAIKEALRQLIERHEALRTRFFVASGGPVQQPAESFEIPLQVVEASSWDDETLHRELDSEAQRPLDLEKGTVFRLVLFQTDVREGYLLLSMDHLVSDLWSMAILVRDLAELYAADRESRPPRLPQLPVGYTDYVRWQKQWLSGAETDRLGAFWERQLRGDLPVLDLPTDRPRPPRQTLRGDACTIDLSGELTGRLQELGREYGATLYMVLMAAFQVLLHRWSGQDDLIVGSVTSGRQHPKLANLVGYFINPVAIRGDLSEDPSFVTFLGQMRQTILTAFEHDHYPPALLAERIALPRDPSRAPLFQAMFIFQKPPQLGGLDLSSFALGHSGSPVELGDLRVHALPLKGQPAQFDLTLVMAETDQGMAARFDYNADIFESETMRRMLGHFRTLLESVAASPELAVSELPLLRPAERADVLAMGKGPIADPAPFADERTSKGSRDSVPEESRLEALFEAQAARVPDRTAAVCGHETLTYHELNQRADELAGRLRGEGVAKGDRVGILLERSLEMVVAVLGILKAGGAFVPLDPAFPGRRLALQAKDAGVRILVAQPDLVERVFGAPANEARRPISAEAGDPDTAADAQVKPTSSSDLFQCCFGRDEGPHPIAHDRGTARDPAYVMYTSGSTGTPKGVQVSHPAVVNCLRSMAKRPGLNERDVFLAVTTLSFDISVLEILLPLIEGARLVVASREVASRGDLLAQRLTESGATIMQATPATWRMLITSGWEGEQNLAIWCGGEALPRDLADALLSRGRSVWNLYGPTEATIWTSVHRVDSSRGSVPLGIPLENTEMRVLDARLEPVPIGVVGELFIGGDGLADGYLNRPALTDTFFVNHPVSGDAARLYRTGDLVRRRTDGTLEFLGRRDRQTKLRGFRIELPEIESVLRRHPAIEDVVCLLQGGSDGGRILAYVVPSVGSAPIKNEEGPVSSAEVRAFLRQHLPDYMIPSAVVTVDALPLLPSGKVNQAALTPRPANRAELEQEFVPPRTESERQLAELYADLLGLDRVGVEDDFFAVGGHSLLATRLILRVREIFEIELPLRVIFETPTVAGIARAVERAREGGFAHPGDAVHGEDARQTLERLLLDAHLPEEIAAPEPSAPSASVASPASADRGADRILLTGTTGFLGAYLLHELLQETPSVIRCLARAPDSETALARIRENLEAYGIWEPRLANRIIPVAGDLSRPRLGLSQEAFDDLAGTVDVIHHLGAMVNLVYPYGAHKSANVDGTREVLRLASRGTLKPVHFVSSLSVFNTGTAAREKVYRESDRASEKGLPYLGYSKSKLVAEEMCRIANDRGIPVTIYRAGPISGHSRTGVSNPGDILSGLAQIGVALGRVPDLDASLDVVPVDYVCRAIRHLSQQADVAGRAFHLANPQPMPFPDLVAWLRSRGFTFETVPLDQWKADVVTLGRSSAGSGLASFLPLIEEAELGNLLNHHFDCSNTIAGLQGTGVICPPVGPDLLEPFLEFAMRTGLLPMQKA